jgi:hypothetical protein
LTLIGRFPSQRANLLINLVLRVCNKKPKSNQLHPHSGANLNPQPNVPSEIACLSLFFRAILFGFPISDELARRCSA